MSAWHSPQSIYHCGHRAVVDLFTVDVQLQEKADGSFFAFGLFPVVSSVNGEFVEEPFIELKLRSKAAMMYPDAPPGMFKVAIDTVRGLQDKLHPGWQYRGEAICKPKHNALAYDRIPNGGVILFDICTDEETYLSYNELKAEGDRLGLEVVPQLFVGRINEAAEIRQFLQHTSVLGGQLIEGVVIKPLVPMFAQDKKMLYGKFVSESFKEVHRKAWGESNPGTGDILLKLGEMYGTQVRYQKALQHLKEASLIEGSPRDIGLLIKEVPADIKKECEEEIKELLWKYAWPHISRMVGRGIPTWYKELLLTEQFEKDMNEDG